MIDCVPWLTANSSYWRWNSAVNGIIIENIVLYNIGPMNCVCISSCICSFSTTVAKTEKWRPVEKIPNEIPLNISTRFPIHRANGKWIGFRQGISQCSTTAVISIGILATDNYHWHFYLKFPLVNSHLKGNPQLYTE